jgi:hypothetical protein
MDNLMLVPKSSGADFFSAMASFEKPDGVRGPDGVSLNGNTGIFSMDGWDAVEKKKTETPMPSPWRGNVICVRNYAKLAYKEGSKKTFRTREFSSVHEEIELLEIDWSSGKSKTTSVGRFPSYADFKAEESTVDKRTGDVNFPYDYHIVLYILTEGGKMVKYDFAGSTRGNWFDYAKAYKTSEFNPSSLIQAVVEFGTQEKESPLKKINKETGMEEATTYFSGTFKTVGVTPPEGERVNLLMDETFKLGSWMEGWKKRNAETPVMPSAAYQAAELPPRTAIEAAARSESNLRREAMIQGIAEAKTGDVDAVPAVVDAFGGNEILGEPPF